MRTRSTREQKLLDFRLKGYDALAIYNSEKIRGLVHTDEYKAKMKEVQEKFDKEYGT